MQEVPMERSIPPVAMTNVTPSPRIAYGTNDFVIVSKLLEPAKLLLISVKIRNNMSVAPMMIMFCIPCTLT